ncbi:MAG: efflux RND transporter periplasmic adaptor subunit [Anaerolineales bacterium]
MRTNRHIHLLIVLILAALAASGCDVLMKQNQTALQASGVVETVEISVSPELGGQVAEVMVQEGDAVQSGQALFRFENNLLEAQLDQAKTALAQAEANYNLTASQPLDEQRQAAVAAAQLELISAHQSLQTLHEDADLARAKALQNVADARKMVRDAERRVNNLESAAKQTDIDQAKANVVLLKKQLEDAREDYEPYANKPEDNLARATYLSKLAQVQAAYDDAVRHLNNLQGPANEIDLARAKADLEMASAGLADAQREYQKLQNGPDPDELALAQARVKNAEANLVLSEADTRQQQLDSAQAQVTSAQAAVGVIQAQLDELVVLAPTDGTVLTRIVEPGEVIQPGMTAMTIGQLNQLTVKVYIPEDRYGQIDLGDHAQVTTDSFPGEAFDGTVKRIAQQAEYTPRNVQTQEDRRTTVFAVELSVSDPSGKLKPGMPVDVQFGS